MPATVNRKVFFYRVVPTQLDDNGIPRRLAPAHARRAVEALDFATGERYFHTTDGNDVCAWPELRQGHTTFRLGTVRRVGLPQIEDAGTIRPLMIGRTQGLVEQTHIVFFPNRIVGVEFNFYGPRISRLTHYLEEKAPQLPSVAFAPLLNDDIAQTLQTIEDVRVLQLRIHRDYLDLLQEAEQSLPAALRATADNIESPMVEIVLRQAPYSRRTLGARALDLVRTLGRRPETREAALLFKVKGQNSISERVEWFDLLSDQFVSERRVVRHDDRHRQIDTDSMFSEIESAYEELQPQLEQAAALHADD